MIKVALARALHTSGYIHVDGGGVAITRRKDYREWARITAPVKKKMILFDRERASVKPFAFTLHFERTTTVYASTAARRERVNVVRNEKRARGVKDKKYSLQSRIIGLAA
jgi:hypothetical protein